jgi:hypothetical protein
MSARPWPIRPWPIHVTAALAALIVFAGPPAKAADLPVAPVPDLELEKMRGGYLIADGIQFNFGALLSTRVNGQVAFQTQVTFTPGGPQIAQTVGPNAVQGASVSNGTINGLNLQGFSPKDITLLNNGATALIQKVSGGSVQNIVINAADNQNIQQSTQLQLRLPGFAQTAQLFQQNLAMLHLLQSGQTSLATGH